MSQEQSLQLPVFPVRHEVVRMCFNESRVHERQMDKTFTAEVTRNRLLSPEQCLRAGQPAGTRSQVLTYRWKAQEIVRAHRYLRPDGEIGGGGRPVPKRVVCCGAILREPSR